MPTTQTPGDDILAATRAMQNVCLVFCCHSPAKPSVPESRVDGSGVGTTGEVTVVFMGFIEWDG